MGHHHDHDHASGHAHGPHAPAGVGVTGGADAAVRQRARRALLVVLAITAGYSLVELLGGLIAGSVALLADAAHMLSDSASTGVALAALWLAARPASARLSFGWRRAEILAALINGVALVAVGLWVTAEAAGRLGDPPEVRGGATLVIGLIGLGVNLLGAAVLWRTGGESLNVRAALLHVLADLAGSVGVIVSAVVILLTGWLMVDPLLGMAIGLLVLVGSWRVLRDSIAVLLEATPQGIDGDRVGQRMAQVDGVVEVHDLHIWTISPGFPALAAHVLSEPGRDCAAGRRALATMLASEFGIAHTTLQVEPAIPERRLHPVSTT